MAFTNRIRLPFKLHKPQFQEESERYRKANGETVTLSVVVRKIYEGVTDQMPEKLHERLKIALAHDHVTVEGERYVGVITQDGDYNIEWSDFMGRPIAPAKFKAEVTPFNASNSNCGTCEEYTQIVCNDDDAGTLAEDTTYVIDVLANDDICCSPVALTLVTFNSTYLDSCVVNGNNEIVIHTKASLPAVNDVLLVTYRAQCQNGQYDEANVIAGIDGTDPTPVCNPPVGLAIGGITDTYAQATWSAPTPAPGAYDWELHELSNLGVPIFTGNIIDLYADLPSLTPSTSYRFYVKSDCTTIESAFVYIDFTTNPESGSSENCGAYDLFNNDFPDTTAIVSYIDCNGDEQTIFIPGQNSSGQICVLQSSPGNPVQMNISGGSVIINYLGLC